jgi:hypothetical protein
MSICYWIWTLLHQKRWQFVTVKLCWYGLQEAQSTMHHDNRLLHEEREVFCRGPVATEGDNVPDDPPSLMGRFSLLSHCFKWAGTWQVPTGCRKLDRWYQCVCGITGMWKTVSCWVPKHIAEVYIWQIYATDSLSLEWYHKVMPLMQLENGLKKAWNKLEVKQTATSTLSTTEESL